MKTSCNSPLKSNGIKRIILILLVIVLTVGFIPAVNGSYADAYSGNVGYAGGYFSYDNADYMLTLVNEQRELYGLSTLDMDYEMLDAAMIRAFECTQYFSHYRPDGSDPSSLCSKIYSENISWGRDAAGTMSGWMASAPHRDNILDPDYKSIGIGSYITSDGSPYWVLVFSYESAYNIAWEYDGDGWICYENGVKVKSKWINDGGEWYYIKSNGYMAANEWAKDSNGWRWMSSSGKVTRSKWIKRGGEWYYLGSDGYMTVNAWVKDSKGWMWMDNDGHITKSKWIKYNDYWYYLKETGYMAVSEWIVGSKGSCYVNAKGRMLSSKWLKYEDEWYYFKSNGYMNTSEWLKYKNEWYYFDADGHMVSEEWVSYKTFKIWMDADGIMARSCWVKDNGIWYYVDDKGYMMTDAWLKYHTRWYYLMSDGSMSIGWNTIDGKDYYFDSSGRMERNKWIDDCYVKSNGAKAVDEYTPDGIYVGADGKSVVYWSPDGQVYHARKDCTALKGSGTVNEGTISESGMQELCSLCCGGN